MRARGPSRDPSRTPPPRASPGRPVPPREGLCQRAGPRARPEEGCAGHPRRRETLQRVGAAGDPWPLGPRRPACPHSGGTSVRRGGCWGRGRLQQRDPQGPDLLQAPRPCLFCSLPGVRPGTGLGLRPPVPCLGPWQVVARPALSGSPCPPAHAAGGLARPGARGSSVFTPQKDLPAEAPLRGPGESSRGLGGGGARQVPCRLRLHCP